MRGRIVLDPDVYDKLKDVADRFGGVGSGGMFEKTAEGDYDITRPLCAYGLAYVAGIVQVTNPLGPEVGAGYAGGDDLYNASKRRALPFSCKDSDDGVGHGRGPKERIPFSQWAMNMNIVRGER